MTPAEKFLEASAEGITVAQMHESSLRVIEYYDRCAIEADARAARAPHGLWANGDDWREAAAEARATLAWLEEFRTY